MTSQIITIPGPLKTKAGTADASFDPYNICTLSIGPGY